MHPDELVALGDEWLRSSEALLLQEEALRQRVQDVSLQWSGAAQVAFLARYATIRSEMLRQADTLRRSGLAVRDIADHYAQLDADAATAITG